jgi:hypothetical protein
LTVNQSSDLLTSRLDFDDALSTVKNVLLMTIKQLSFFATPQKKTISSHKKYKEKSVPRMNVDLENLYDNMWESVGIKKKQKRKFLWL